MAQAGHMGQVRWAVWLVLGIFIMASVAYAQDVGVNLGELTQLGSTLGVVTGDLLIIQVNSSQFWDNLDTPADIFLNDLGDVDASTPLDGEVLTFDTGSNDWVPGFATGANGSVDNANISYLNGTLPFTEDQIIEGNLNVTGNLTGRKIYGSMWSHSPVGTIIDLIAVDEPVNITGFESTYNNGFFLNNNNYSLIVGRQGLYHVTYSMAISGGSNKEYVSHFVVQGNELEEGITHHTAKGGASLDTISVSFYTQINASQEIWVDMRQIDTPLRDPTYVHFSLTIEMVDSLG